MIKLTLPFIKGVNVHSNFVSKLSRIDSATFSVHYLPQQVFFLSTTIHTRSIIQIRHSAIFVYFPPFPAVQLNIFSKRENI
mmetsp:Transcript_28416/g.60555  ORF Transcript_28416/g.60555 Transcript_28416/m.60555 type:complete len:81 (-) Transcript_28416:894-1136(-)